MSGAGAGQEQGRSRVKQSGAERGQRLGRKWGGASNVQDRSLKGAGWDRSRSGSRSRRVARRELSTYQISPKLY